jgi:single-strand DNA-binding protein
MANDHNRVSIIGRMTADAQIKQAGTNKVCTVTVANNRKYNDKEQVSFFNCIFWNKSAELIAQYGGKGKRLLVDGRLQQRSYENKDGKKQSVIEIFVENFQLLDYIKNKESDITQVIDDNFGAQSEFSDDVPF